VEANDQLELFWQPSLFQNTIGRVTRFNAIINNNRSLRIRAKPDFVIAFALTIKSATSFL